MSNPTQTPAGWYDDGSGTQRWWDGQQWTAAPADAAAPGIIAGQRPSTPKTLAMVAIIIGGVAFLVGLVPVFGALVGAAAIVVGVLALRARQPKVLSVVGVALGGIAALTSITMTVSLASLPKDGSPAALAGSQNSQSAEDPAPEETVAAKPVPEDTAVEEPGPEPTVSSEPETIAEPAPAPTEAEVEEEPEEPELSLSQENAVDQAMSYLEFMAFSRSGLIDQLKYEGYHTSEAKFAVDYLDVNWSKQAALKAQSYLDTSAFSRQGLIDQLRYEGFTAKQAKYGVKAVGY